jgi:AcrR family transcriptional regulator
MAARVRERSKGATREALIEAAVAEFSERGLDAPSLDAICARAGFTRGAFYVHFRNREELVAAVVQRALGAFFDAIIATGDGPHDLERTVRRFEEAVVGISTLRLPGRGGGDAPAGVPFHRLVEACERSPALRAQLVRLLREAVERVAKTAGAGQAAATVRADVDAEALASLLVTLALGFVAALDAGLPFDPPAARRAVLALLAPRSR